MHRRLWVGGLWCYWVYIAGVAHAQRPEPLSIETALGQPAFPPYTPIALSPDGKWVAYALEYPDRVARSAGGKGYVASGVPHTALGSRVWLTEVSSGRTLPLGAGAATSWAPAWSPDGKWLAFYSDGDGVARLWVREAATGEIRPVSDAIIRASTALQRPRWMPGSNGVIVPILPHGAPLPEAQPSPGNVETDATRELQASTATVLHADPVRRYGGDNPTDPRAADTRGQLAADLALIGLPGGTVTTLAHGYSPVEYSASPDARFLVFTSELPTVLRPRWTVPYDLVIVPLVGRAPGQPRTIASNIPIADFSRSVAWSPDGTTILYSVLDDVGREQLLAVSPQEGRPRRLGATGVAALGTEPRASSGQSLWWDQHGGQFYVLERHGVAVVSMPGGKVTSAIRTPPGYQAIGLAGYGEHKTALGLGSMLFVAFSNESTMRMGFARVDLRQRTWTVIREEDRYYGNGASFRFAMSDTGGGMFLSEDARHPRDLWSVTRDFTVARQVTHTTPAMERVEYGPTRLVEWTTRAGAPRQGTLILPSGYRAGQRYPLVVYPYPSDRRSQYVNVFGVIGTGVENLQLLATRGFAVLAPDIPPIDTRDEMHELASVILPAVDRIVALGIADSARVGVMGHSWGGYATLALLVQTQRFRAAIVRGGHGDNVATYGALQTSGYAFGIVNQEKTLGGTLWEQRDRYLANSPIYFFDRIHTPVLLIHGESETTVPIFLANQVFASLQRLGKEVEFVRYGGEDHSEEGWSYANQRDYLRRMIGWFEARLTGKRR